MKKKFELPRHGLIISCQAAEGEPLYGLHLMRYMAKAAAAGGAVAIRALAEEIPEIKAETGLPVIGLVKKKICGQRDLHHAYAERDRRSFSERRGRDCHGRDRPSPPERGNA